ncbi:MAG: peroxiredoxin family protein, partial [Candidatus Binatia bacterium]
GMLFPGCESARVVEKKMNAHGSRISVCLFFLSVWLWSGPGSAQESRSQSVNYKLVPNLQEMKERAPTPAFTLPDLQGKKISLKDFRGKLVFLNFWASWCIPCREEMPAMERLYQEFREKGFVVVAVNVMDGRDDALAFVKELKVTYPVLLDPQGDVGQLYGAWGLPTTYLIGVKGEGLARMWGPAEWYSPGARELIGTLVDKKR